MGNISKHCIRLVYKLGLNLFTLGQKVRYNLDLSVCKFSAISMGSFIEVLAQGGLFSLGSRACSYLRVVCFAMRLCFYGILVIRIKATSCSAESLILVYGHFGNIPLAVDFFIILGNSTTFTTKMFPVC